MLLEVQHISKSFEVIEAPGASDANSQSGSQSEEKQESTQVLRDVSFTLDRGESLALVAPSGTGKSTLLSIVGLLLEPTSGKVLYDGVDVSTLSDDERSRLRCEDMGFLFQHTQLIGSLRAIENVALPADFIQSSDRRLSSAEVQEKAAAALTRFGLEDRMYHYPSQLSIGQKRRIATARALFLDPTLIIADEPTNDLDPVNSKRVIEALFSRVKSGEAALIYATHDKELAGYADKTLELS